MHKLGFLLIVLLVILPCVFSDDIIMRIYPESLPLDTADERIAQKKCQFGTDTLTSCSIPGEAFKCSTEGRYFAAVRSTESCPSTTCSEVYEGPYELCEEICTDNEGITCSTVCSQFNGGMVTECLPSGCPPLDARMAPCDSIQGDYSIIFNCTLYSVDYDSQWQHCNATNPACVGETGAVWDPLAESGQGECCGDDPFGANPSGVNHTVDDPDMGKQSCSKCSKGFNDGTPANRDWSDSVNSASAGSACCGDDFSKAGFSAGPGDCMSIVANKYMCLDRGGSYSLDCVDNCDSLIGDQVYELRYTSGKWNWADASKDVGAIIDVSCSRIPLLSTGSSWVSCENHSVGIDSAKLFSGDSFGNPVRTVGNHDYVCYFNSAPRIAECCSGSSLANDCNLMITTPSGLQQFGGVAKPPGGFVKSTPPGLANTTYYCSLGNKWSVNLDGKYEVCSPDCASYDYSVACAKANLGWSGNYCCGEADDIEEFFIDRGGPGACVNNSFVQNGRTLSYRGADMLELFVHNGSLLGCAIDENNAGAKPGYVDPNRPYEGSFGKGRTNDFVMSWKNYPDSKLNKNSAGGTGSLVTDVDYCSIAGPNNRFFCSYTGVWMDAGSSVRNHLSYLDWVPDSPGIQVAECCSDRQCWDGASCSDTFDASSAFEAPDGRLLRCSSGSWVPAILKHTWDRQESGYCPLQSQCLVDPHGNSGHNSIPRYFTGLGNPDNPQCINNTQFIMDYYCDNGNWTTRTKMLAMQLAGFAKDSDFTLFCDNYASSLNYYKYRLDSYSHPRYACTTLFENENEVFKVYLGKDRRTSIAGGCLSGCVTNCTLGVGCNRKEVDCANKFCVLRTASQTIVGVTLNQPVNSPYYPFVDLLQGRCTAAQMAGSGNQYLPCTDKSVWYNPGLQAIVFSDSSFGLVPVNWWDVFMTKLRSILDSVVRLISGSGTSTFPFISNNPMMSRLYWAKDGPRTVVAVIEDDVYYESNRYSYLTLSFDGFSENVCDTFASYPGIDLRRPTSGFRCEGQGNTYRIAAIKSQNSKLFDIWKEYTAKLRFD